MRLISVVNLLLAGIILLASIIFIFSGKPEPLSVFVPNVTQKELPKSLFAETDEFFQEIGDGLCALKWVPPQMQLPDLRNELQFFGKNGRPDSLPGKSSFHLCLKGSQEKTLAQEGERLYLVYQGTFFTKERKAAVNGETISQAGRPIWGDVAPKNDSLDKNLYVFSPGNQPTPLWLEVHARGESAVDVKLSMLDEKGALVTAPNDLHIFQLQALDHGKTQVLGWDLGGLRVDTTLLSRQRARWVGQDMFLKLHGGDEFAHSVDKERIDFFDGPNHCSCFVGPGDFIVWRNQRWEVAKSAEETQQLPLLYVKKIEDKIMTFELWDPEGRGKVILSLIRTKDHQGLPNISQEIKFVGAKTWAQFIVECKTGGRLTLRPHDWLVLTSEGWTKLDTPSQIDAFVNQTITGPLFILDEMAKKNGRQVLCGHLFNTTRTEVEEVELTSVSATPLANFYRHLPVNPPIQPKLLDAERGSE